MNIQAPRARRRFWLRLSEHDIELPVGDTFIGRSTRCQFVIDDPLVSRRHTVVHVGEARAEIEDLGSVNGTWVNGQRVVGSQRLESGDQVSIGRHQLKVFSGFAQPDAERDALRTTDMSPAETLAEQSADDEESTHKGDMLSMLGAVADKALNMGRADEAERILSGFLNNLLSGSRTGNPVEASMAARAAAYAIKLASASGQGRWINFVFELYQSVLRPMPADVIEQLYQVAPRVSGVRLELCDEYVNQLQTSARLGPTDRFLLRRLAGLAGQFGLRSPGG